MGTASTLLTPDIIGYGLAGLLIFGLIVRNFVKGWFEARSQASSIGSNTAAMVGAVSIQWDRDQREIFLQTMVRIAVAQEMQAKHQEGVAQAAAALADKHRQHTDNQLEQILERLDKAEVEQDRPPRPRR